MRHNGEIVEGAMCQRTYQRLQDQYESYDGAYRQLLMERIARAGLQLKSNAKPEFEKVGDGCVIRPDRLPAQPSVRNRTS